MIGILGGTFDPVHVGHITLATELQQQLQLEYIRLLPCKTPAHKSEPSASVEDRLEMLKRATRGTSLVIDEREIRRHGPSYTVDTLLSFRDEIGYEQPLILCMGADALCGLMTWDRWKSIIQLTHLAILRREGAVYSAELQDFIKKHRVETLDELKKQAAGRIYFPGSQEISVSSTAIREALSAGKPVSGLLAPAVEAYIQQRGLYNFS